MKTRIKLTGYFKFSAVKTAEANIPGGDLAEPCLRQTVGQDVLLGPGPGPLRDVWNAVAGKCGELGWYRDGGWRPHGGGSYRCREKDKGDVLGVRASAFGWSAWLYCDREFEKALLEDFFSPDERLRLEVAGGVRGRLRHGQEAPGQRWLDAFCRRTHDPDAFARRKYGREITRAEAANAVKTFPKLAKYIKTMLMPKED